jgi:hypothetical protein
LNRQAINFSSEGVELFQVPDGDWPICARYSQVAKKKKKALLKR